MRGREASWFTSSGNSLATGRLWWAQTGQIGASPVSDRKPVTVHRHDAQIHRF